MLRVKIWLKIWEKLSFSCFHLLFLEAQVSGQYNLSWLQLGTKSWSIYTSSSGNSDLLSYKAIHVHCVYSRGPVWGFRGGSAGADIHVVCRPMGGRALSIREGGIELKGPESACLWNSAFTELGQILTSICLWGMCWLPSKVPLLTWLLNNSYMKCWEVGFFFSFSVFPVFLGKLWVSLI